MPEADGLFHKGIIESGVVDPDLLGDAEDRNGREIVKAMLAELGLEEKMSINWKPFLTISLRRLMKMQHRRLHKKANMSKSSAQKSKLFRRCDQTWISGRNEKIPLLIGTVLGEFDFGPAISGKYEVTRKEVEEKVRDALGERRN